MVVVVSDDLKASIRDAPPPYTDTLRTQSEIDAGTSTAGRSPSPAGPPTPIHTHSRLPSTTTLPLPSPPHLAVSTPMHLPLPLGLPTPTGTSTSAASLHGIELHRPPSAHSAVGSSVSVGGGGMNVMSATPQMRALTAEDREAEEGRRYQQQLLARCAQGDHAPKTTYGPAGIISSVLLFPIGLFCLLWDRETRCARCNERLKGKGKKAKNPNTMNVSQTQQGQGQGQPEMRVYPSEDARGPPPTAAGYHV